ncbi:MAG: hypothetical protein ACLR8O_08230 [Streptococcus thermophilus]
MNGKDKIKNVRNVWVKGFIDKKGDIIIPVNNEGAIHIIKEPYKNETAFKFEEFKLITNTLALEVAESGLRTFAPNIYKFPKVDEPQKVTVPKFVAKWIKKIYIYIK